MPQANPEEATRQGPHVEVSIGGAPGREHPHLSFTITSVHEGQNPSPIAPYHVPGGEWTYLDCETTSEPRAAFTVGLWSQKSTGPVPVAWGRAALIVKDREAGVRFLDSFRTAFPGAMPAPAQQAVVPGPLFIKTAILGDSLDRDPRGGFSGRGGGWSATKWFPEQAGLAGEIYFNWNLGQRQGEWSEKDAACRDRLLEVFALALRDGPRPERTPQNDPHITASGPRIGQPRKLLSRLASCYSFSPNGQWVVYQDGAQIFALAPDKPGDQPVAIACFDHSPWEVRVLDNDLTLLVQEGVPEKTGVKSSGDPMRVWWVNPRQKGRLLRGPEKDISLADASVSPDRRLIGLCMWRDNPGGKGRTKHVEILDRESGKSTRFMLPGKDLSLVSWKNTAAGLRAVMVTNRWRIKEEEVSELYLADPTAGALTLQKDLDPRFEIDNPLSPDEKHRVRVEKDRLVVMDAVGANPRAFAIREDEQRFVHDECIEWVSSRYVQFNGPKLALLDVTTMKMCFPATLDRAQFASHTCKFSSDLRWVLYQGEGVDGEGFYLAPVAMVWELKP
jgi:hypothetical protein